MKVGFIGLGRMGGGLARNLIRNGYEVNLYDIRAEAALSISREVGGAVATSVSEAVDSVDVVFTSVPLPADLESLLLDASGVLSSMKPGATVIDVSTIDPQTARKLADAAAARGFGYLECPLGKGPKQAEDGTEPVFAGGNYETFQRHRELLEKIGSPVYYLGDVEQSTAFKLISNLIGMTNMTVLAEGLRLGERAGINQALLQQLLSETGADSYQLHLRGPWLLAQDYAPRFSVNLTAKDLRLVVGMAGAWGQPSEFGGLALKYYESAQQRGFGDQDTGAVYKVMQNTHG